MVMKLQDSEVRDTLKLHTDLSEPQQRLMRNVVRLLPFAASLPQQDVCVFTMAKDEQILVFGHIKDWPQAEIMPDIRLLNLMKSVFGKIYCIRPFG